MNYIFGKKQFIAYYKQMTEEERKSTVWIIVHTSDGEDIYLKEYNQWLTIRDYCNENKLFINAISLQWRSHIVTEDTAGRDGVYVIKTAKGSMGGKTQECYSVATINGDKIRRHVYSVPALSKEMTFEDNLKNCIEKAIVLYDHQQAKVI